MRSVLFTFTNLICCFLLFSMLHGQPVEWLHTSVSGSTRGVGVGMDKYANAVAAGILRGSATFGPYHLNDSGSYIVKYNASGNIVWAHEIKGASINSIFVTDSSDFFVTGGFTNNLKIDSLSWQSHGNTDIFVLHYDSNCKVIRALAMGGPGNETGRAMAYDPYGNLIVVGTFDSSVTLSQTTLESSGGKDIFIMKLDTVLKTRWIRKAGGHGDDQVNSVSADGNANISFTGGFIGDFSSSSLKVASAGGKDAYVCYLTADGNTSWLKDIGGSGADEGMGITMEANGNTYITGYFNGTASFDNIQLSSTGGADVFLARYKNTGDLVWAQRFGGTGNDQGNAVMLDGSYNAHMAGSFENDINFDNSHFLHSSGGSDAFLVVYDISGRFSQARSIGGKGMESASSVALDVNSNSIVTGSLGGDVAVDTLNAHGDTAGTFFITKIDFRGTGIAESLPGRHFRVYPNPFAGQINLQSDNGFPDAATVTLYDITGKMRFQSTGMLQQTISIDATSFPPGIYMLQIASPASVSSYRLVKL